MTRRRGSTLPPVDCKALERVAPPRLARSAARTATIAPLQPAPDAGCRGRRGSPSRRRFSRPAAAAPAPRPAPELSRLSPQLLPDHAQALLALADGTVFHGSSIGAAGAHRRRSGVQHRDDRLSGNPHRPELLPADRHADVSAHRQLRRQRRRRRGGAGPCRRPGHQGPAAARLELPQRRLARRVPAAREHGRHRRHRHPQADAPPAHAGRAERLHRRACRAARR